MTRRARPCTPTLPGPPPLPHPAQFNCSLTYSPATDLSAVDRWYGTVVIRATAAGQLLAFLLPPSHATASSQGAGAGAGARAGQGAGGGQGQGQGQGTAKAALPLPPCPVPAVTAAFVETERAAAHR